MVKQKKEQRENIEDEFKISYGNLLVLKSIPEMLLHSRYRRELRLLTLKYLTEVKNS